MFSKELTDEDIINIVVNPKPTQNLEKSDSNTETKEKEKIDWSVESLNKLMSYTYIHT